MKTNLRYVFTITILFLSFYFVQGQQNYWSRISTTKKSANSSLQNLKEGKYTVLSLDENSFKEELAGVKLRNSNKTGEEKVVWFPDEKGSLIAFTVYEAPVLAPELSALYPQIKSYIGFGVKEQVRVRFSVSENEVKHMMTFAGGRVVFMEKYAKNSNEYISYTRGARTSVAEMNCTTKVPKPSKKTSYKALRDVNDRTLRTFELAVSTTGEYTVFHGGTVAGALAAINATVTRINEVYEIDLGMSFLVISETSSVIFTDPDTDPYESSGLNTAVQNVLTTQIGEANYDVGHLFHLADNNGNAGCIGCVCDDGLKGSAFSATNSPTGDIFDIDYVSHELGHQFGANHTWSFDSEGTGVNMEPGSGTTIMGYAGITGPDDVQPNSDPYFHYASIDQITDYIFTTSCADETPLANNPPVANAGNDYIIPTGTAFLLEGSATDPDGDNLTYTWEQADDGIVGSFDFGPDNARGANFRSLPPSTNPNRYFPRLSRILSGNLTQSNPSINEAWETVSNVGRDLNFALTVRDNATGGGQTSSDLVKITVENEAGPFSVTSQSGAVNWTSGTVETITWDVARTNIAPINATEIDILFSINGGNTFPFVIAQNISNDGSHEFVVPGGIDTSNGRFMIRPSNNVFLAVNSGTINVTGSDFVMNFPYVNDNVCQPDNLTVPFEYNTYNGFNQVTTFTTSGLPAGLNISFNPASATADATAVQMLISGTAAVTPGLYTFTVTGTGGGLTKNIDFDLIIAGDTLEEITLQSPADGATGVFFTDPFQWQEDLFAESYDIEIATDAGFSTIVESATVTGNTYTASSLMPSTTYFWRVKSRNECGESNFGAPFSFSTANINCKTFPSGDTPVLIPGEGTPTVIAEISITDDLPITDVNVFLDISHTFISDLRIRLRSPLGTEVVLFALDCFENDNIVATFDDDGVAQQCMTNPAISGTVRPEQVLSAFNDESTEGVWQLIVEDTFDFDGGSINVFELEICAGGIFTFDRDGDGVIDDEDNCPDTANANQLDSDGDGIGDVCDPDDDNDGVLDVNDNCPFLVNPDQADNDSDGIGDLCDDDDDNDGVLDVNDNCPFTANTDQLDTDLDGEGDACDTDDDDDGIEDAQDNCTLTFNPDQLDIDNDGEGDVCDQDILVSEAITPNGDGINDTWNIVNIELYPNSIVRIYNKSGSEIFRTSNYQNDWNGTYKDRSEKLPSGPYYYQIDLNGNGSVDNDGWIYITY